MIFEGVIHYVVIIIKFARHVYKILCKIEELTIPMMSMPAKIAAPSFERNGFQTLYSTLVPSSF